MDYQKWLLGSFILSIPFTFCTSKDSITINQTFINGNLLISKGNNFAFGFFSPGRSEYRYLGIWYHKIPGQTVVWVANRNDPIKSNSGVLSIDHQSGNLILHSNYDKKVPIWSTNVSMDVKGTYTCSAKLLDSGNFVLVENTSKRTVWESFDHPSDTMLPGMKFRLKQRLTSWRSPDDPGFGDFSFQIKPKGSPQFFYYNSTKPYWRSIPWPWKSFHYMLNYSFVNNQNEIYFSSSVSDTSMIIRSKIYHTGIMKMLVWQESIQEWKEVWSGPKYQCEAYGQCGAFGKCNPSLITPRFECDCLPGYEPKSAREWNILRDWSKGCVSKRIGSSSVCGNGEGFVRVELVKNPDTSTAVWIDMNMSHMDCEMECTRNCSCSAYASISIPGKGIGCLAWYGELIDTVHIMDDGYDLYVRVDAIELANNRKVSSDLLQMKGKLAILVISVVSTWFTIIFFAYLWLRKKRKKGNKWRKRLLDAIHDPYHHKDALLGNEGGGSRSHPDVAFFNFRALVAATNNFSETNKLGQGGFGSVYKGQLSSGQEVAIKRLSKNSGQGIEEFINEVALISKLQHRNLVKLLGCCIQEEEPMLIYEYLPNKSLDHFIFGKTVTSILDWRKRFDIIIRIARGILYLHQDSRLTIIHRDLKASNILLDAEMNPKISDFGMARTFTGEQIQERTKRVVGTFGYMSPEYVLFGKFSIKSYVFSYGVILLEILTGKKNSSFSQEDSSQSLIEYVWKLWVEGRALEIVDSSLKEAFVSHEVMRCVQIGLLCVQENANDRPTMSAVVLMLNSETHLPCPNQPAFIFNKPCNNLNMLASEESYSVNTVTISDIVSR